MLFHSVIKNLIGITTYCSSEKRFNAIRAFFDSLLDVNKSIFRNYDLYVADDHSSHLPFCSFLDTLKSRGFKVIRGDVNLGIAGNSNRLFKIFEGGVYPYMFKLEDDNKFLKDGIFEIYTMLMRESSQKHFSFRSKKYFRLSKDDGDVIETINNFNIRRYKKTNGVFLTLSREVFNKIGGFGIAPEKWGEEHLDFSERCRLAKLCDSFCDFDGSNDYFEVSDLNECFSNFSLKQREYMGARNKKWYEDKIRTEGVFRKI